MCEQQISTASADVPSAAATPSRIRAATATSMLSDLVKGRTAGEVASMPKEELLDELGIPLTPVRLKCAILGLGVLKLALHKARGTPLPEEWGTSANELVLE